MKQYGPLTLYVVAVYLTVFGVLFLFLPSVAEKVLSTSLPDAALNMLYGQLTLTFAYVAFLAARGGDGLGKLSRILLVLQFPAPSFHAPKGFRMMKSRRRTGSSQVWDGIIEASQQDTTR